MFFLLVKWLGIIILLLFALFFLFLVKVFVLSRNFNKKGFHLDRNEKNYKKTEGTGVYDQDNLELEHPVYDQFHIVFDQQHIIGLPFVSKNMRARVGCGPVAWAMIFNLYGKTNKIPKFKTLFPDDLDGAIPEIIELGNILGTVNGGKTKKYGVGGGFTWPHHMPRAQVYLKDTGYRMQIYYNTFGWNLPMINRMPKNNQPLWEIAVEKVKSGVPILIGYKCYGILHYAISHGYRKNADGQDEIYANNGHSVVDFDNEWMKDPNLPEEKRNRPFYMVAWLEPIKRD